MRLEFGYYIPDEAIRDNILFSHEYDEQFYNLVLDGMLTRSAHCSHALTVTYSMCHAA
jgi:hypothetical protein